MSHSKGGGARMITTWKVTINLSGENHIYYRKDTIDNALFKARKALCKSNGITYARAINLNYEIKEVKEIIENNA